MSMQLLRLARPAYVSARNGLTAIGLFGPLRKWLGPLAGRIASRITADPSRPAVVLGHRMILAARGTFPPIAMATNNYEQATTKVFMDLVKPGMGVIDVGAHVGYYSLLAARQVGPSGEVYSFEPEPSNHELLLKNIELNGYSNIVPMRKAVANQVGSTELFLTALDNGRHSTYRHKLPERGSVSVDTTTVDDFLENQGWPRVDLVKVDVEGAEADVVRGMEGLFRKSEDFKLIIEFSPALLQDGPLDPLQFLELLTNHDLEIHRIVENEDPVALPKEEWPATVEKLTRSQGSVNLLCTRR